MRSEQRATLIRYRRTQFLRALGFFFATPFMLVPLALGSAWGFFLCSYAWPLVELSLWVYVPALAVLFSGCSVWQLGCCVARRLTKKKENL